MRQSSATRPLLPALCCNWRLCVRVRAVESFTSSSLALVLPVSQTQTIQESRAAARKPRDAASVLFGRSSPTTFLTSVRARWPIGLTLSDVLLLIDVCDKVP